MQPNPLALVFRALLIAALPPLFYYTAGRGGMWVTSALLFALWLALVRSLVRLVQKQNRELHAFLDAFEKGDGTRRLSEGPRRSPGLSARFNKIADRYSEAEAAREKELFFFQTCLRSVPVGVLAFDARGAVEFCNPALLELLGLGALAHLRALDAAVPGLAEKLRRLPPNQSRLFTIEKKRENMQLLARAAKFRQGEKNLRVLTFQNIRREIDQSEMEAWSKLIRVLTHEIINSISPIRLLTGSLAESLEESHRAKGRAEAEELEETLAGLRAINKRARGLGHFVDSYRKLAKIPEPQLEVASLRKLLRRIDALIQPDMRRLEVDFRLPELAQDFRLLADEKLVEQVLLNLLRNAAHAVADQERPRIEIRAAREKNAVLLRVRDNGDGIAEGLLEDIFIPFFTTKEEGSGIGLSLSRQIMRKHGGELSVRSARGRGAEFTLRFPFHSNLTSSASSKPAYEESSTRSPGLRPSKTS